MKSQGLSYALLATISALITVWPLPETMALRNLLLVVGAALAIPLTWKNRMHLFQRDAWPIWLSAAFFLWLAFHYLVLTSSPKEQLSELQGVWARAAISSIIGLAAGLTILLREPRAERGTRQTHWFITVGLSATTLIYAIGYLFFCIKRGEWITPPFFQEIYRGKPPIVVFVGLALVIYFIKAYETLLKRSLLELSIWSTLILLSLFDFVFTGTKNGVIVFALTAGAFILIAARGRLEAHQKRLVRSAAVGLILIALPVIVYHVRENEAWRNLWPDIKAAWDIEGNPQWKQMGSYTLPQNENMRQVNQSTYERIAWAHAGLTLIQEHPLGYGLLYHSFGALAAKKWADFHKPNGVTRGATHSAWIDMTLGVGVPGTILFASGLLLAFARTRRLDGFWRTYVLSTIPLLFFIFLITEVASDVYVEFLFMMTFMFLGMTLRPHDGKRKLN